MKLKINKKIISNGSKTYFIADIAANHDGDLNRAKKLIKLAAIAGANAVKFQHFQAKTIVSDYGFKRTGKIDHQSKWKKSVFKIFSYSFLSFIIWNSITSWWLVNSTVFGMFFAIILYSILMALVFTSYSLISKKLGSKLGVIFFISSWIVFEKFNLSWEFSWPSLILGNVFSESHQLIQWFEFTGTLGGSIWILIVNLLFFKTLNKYLSNKYYLKNLSIGLLNFLYPLFNIANTSKSEFFLICILALILFFQRANSP